jgi:polysaccharide pyruvyl transferase WcaK-like protein
MDTITIVDTSICTDNLGDEIIMEAVNNVVHELFPNAYIFRVPSHEALSDRTRKFIAKSSFCFIGGTNLLSSHIGPRGLWRLTAADANLFCASHTACLGTGWNDYMPAPNRQTKRILQTTLSPHLIHAARDSYTRDHLDRIGIRAVTASCPTAWPLTPGHCALIPKSKAPAVVFTLSAWRSAPAEDLAWMKVLKRNYPKLLFFPQMQDDYAYFRSFGFDEIGVINPTTEAYTKFIENENVDVIGTRLHGGIRALQKGRRALILAIDNRATEMSKDIALPVIRRDDTAAVENWIHGGEATAVALPQTAMDLWKRQFSAENIVKLPQPIPGEIRHLSTVTDAAKRIMRYGAWRVRAFKPRRNMRVSG